jgi:hypothetical protein
MAGAEKIETEIRDAGAPNPIPVLCDLDQRSLQAVTTAWGGIFYLINVALALGLYGDFTTPRQPGLALPVWDFLAMIGRRLVGPEFETDPLWEALATLSNCGESEFPAHWFDPPNEWRIPADWLVPFTERTGLHWAMTSGRMRVVHPSGFLVLDVALEGDRPAQQLAGELQRIGVQAARTPDQEFPHPFSARPLDRWLDWLVPFIQARLGRALGETSGETLRDLVFRYHARIEMTAARVGVRFRLADHPVELRLAGLDRDPGWVPAAGKEILFFYD